MKKIYSVILLLAVMLSSCTKDETDIMTDDNSNAPALAKTRSDGSDMVEYELLPNPYTVDVIQGVYDSYNVSKTIEPTDLYVRFLPQDSLQLIALKTIMTSNCSTIRSISNFRKMRFIKTRLFRRVVLLGCIQP